MPPNIVAEARTLPVGRSVALVLLAAYKKMVSPLFAIVIGPGCRFEPTCSDYAAQAIASYGVRRGGWMAIRRLSRCRPGAQWGYDPIRPNRRHPLEVER